MAAKKKVLMSYHFNIGNSTRGKIGMCFRVRAYSRKEAVTKANAYLDSLNYYEFSKDEEAGIEYAELYTNAKLTARDIDEEEEAEQENESCSDCDTEVEPDAPYYSTPCGTFCDECMAKHVKDCGVCASEFADDFDEEEEPTNV